MKKLYTKNDKALMEEIKDTCEWERMQCSLIERNNIVKKYLYLNNQEIHCNLSKFQWHFQEIEQF